jgi:hypothetical protein
MIMTCICWWCHIPKLWDKDTEWVGQRMCVKPGREEWIELTPLIPSDLRPYILDCCEYADTLD